MILEDTADRISDQVKNILDEHQPISFPEIKEKLSEVCSERFVDRDIRKALIRIGIHLDEKLRYSRIDLDV